MRRTIKRGSVAPYALPMRPVPVGAAASPVVDLRPVTGAWPELDAPAWSAALRLVGSAARVAGASTQNRTATIKPFDRDRGADHAQLAAVLAALDRGRPVAFYGWWPTESAAATNPTLGFDAMEVPPPDRKGTGLVDGHAVVIVGYGRHGAFPGGGYLLVRNGWSNSEWGDGSGDGVMPFTYLRAYAIELCTSELVGGPAHRDGEGPSTSDRPVAGSARLPEVAPRALVDNEIERRARCSDGRGEHTHLFFSEDQVELARARAICSACTVRELCLRRALARAEPYGIWGGELLIDGGVVADKRGRGRPRKIPLPRLVVDEITGVPIVA